MNELTELLKPHVVDIERDAKQGNHYAEQVINLYAMYLSCPSDPGAPALCKAAFYEWKKGR